MGCGVCGHPRVGHVSSPDARVNASNGIHAIHPGGNFKLPSDSGQTMRLCVRIYRQSQLGTYDRSQGRPPSSSRSTPTQQKLGPLPLVLRNSQWLLIFLFVQQGEWEFRLLEREYFANRAFGLLVVSKESLLLINAMIAGTSEEEVWMEPNSQRTRTSCSFLWLSCILDVRILGRL